ncbi:hypothetical protein A0J48_008355 [Sphaerospermopsis aphanizomenoides BCCUSP55]|uniref:hypothetical protein n=1 Tax=Sphaerospermopsis aphanizomenoides TaxID=459663 RepID=UPI001904BF04|nr:hypothetical protein [Sphaerospermopsis aphanizomenoides]MBK1987547.1 hypothetical protein [Sphaerospermopsis aphanizomenoides BCCUSP55]
MQTLLGFRSKLTSWLYPSMIILLIIQSGLNIARRFIPIPVCKEDMLGNFISFPSLLILLLLLYRWPIDIGKKFKNKPIINVPILSKYQKEVLDIFVAIMVLLFPFIFMMSGLAPEIYDTYRLFVFSSFFLLLPLHIHSHLAYKHNYPHIIGIGIGIIPIIIIFFFIPFLSLFFKSSIIQLIFAILIWLSYFLSFVPKNKIFFLDLINNYNPFTWQLISAEYRNKALSLIVISFLAGVAFFTHAYLIVPRIENFSIYKNAFNDVVEMVKNNQLEVLSDTQFKIPCQYNYLNRFSSVRVDRKDGLTVQFRIFTIGFGDGYTSFVYRSKPLDYKQVNATTYHATYVDFKSLGDSWYWEVWIW